MIKEDKAWLDYRERFASVYDESNYSSSLQMKVMHASHKLIEKPFNATDYFSNVLEVGAGTGEHLNFVNHKYDNYTLSDMDAKTLDVAKNKLAKHPFFGRIKFETQVGEQLSYPDATFDRVIASHVLEHIYQPHLAIKEWVRVLKDGGTLSILIPTDPGMAWRLGRHFGPRKRAIAQGIAYDYVMAREHVNSCNNLIAILKHYFKVSQDAWWPFPVNSIDLNLFYAFHATIKKSDFL